jgi:hypothetical protein
MAGLIPPLGSSLILQDETDAVFVGGLRARCRLWPRRCVFKALCLLLSVLGYDPVWASGPCGWQGVKSKTWRQQLEVGKQARQQTGQQGRQQALLDARHGGT